MSGGLVLFDLDLTLLPIDSDHAWNEFVIARGWVDAAAFRARNDAFYEDYKAGRLDIHAYVAFATTPLRERSPAELAAVHRDFMATVIEPAIRPAARALVESHRAAGDTMALVTSTNDFITAPIAEAFGIDTLIATQLERDSRRAVTGRIAAVPALREGKVERVSQWLAETGRAWAGFDRVVAYSDSINDLPLLERATEPVATNASEPLRRIAIERGWRTLELFA